MLIVFNTLGLFSWTVYRVRILTLSVSVCTHVTGILDSYDMESHGNKIKTPSLEVYEKVKQTVDKLGGATLTGTILEDFFDTLKVMR